MICAKAAIEEISAKVKPVPSNDEQEFWNKKLGEEEKAHN